MAFEDTFKALSDPTRRQILQLLRHGRKNAGEIVREFGLTGATISHHLNILKNAELISDEHEGTFVYYSLNTSVLEDIILWITDLKEGTSE